MENFYIIICIFWCMGWFYREMWTGFEDLKEMLIMSIGACVLVVIGFVFFPQLFS